MLIEIKCEKFRKKKIEFHKGLNVILGDEKATNSIGKSSLLLVIDFVYGGNGLMDRNDIIDELDHHDYFMSFKFDKEVYRFKRGTYQPDIIYQCDSDYQPTSTIRVEEYTSFLKAAYEIDVRDITFRSLVGLYIRVWGKDNLNVHKPLHIVQAMPAKESIDNLLKTFDLYKDVKEIAEMLKSKEKEAKAYRYAFGNKIIPKITKREYGKNERQIARIESEIEEIKVSLSKYVANIDEIVNREILELKVQKDELLDSKFKIQSKLSRVNKNIDGNRYIKSKHFNGLIELFPGINKKKLIDIEEFHNKVARILKCELRETKNDLQRQLTMIETELQKIEFAMDDAISSVDKPSKIIDRIYDLSNSLKDVREKNDYYEYSTKLRNDVKEMKVKLSNTKRQVLSLLEGTINDSMRRIVTSVFGPDRKSPTIELNENNYSYEVLKDTGTGTAYASLIVFDLAIFTNTILPFIAHDSLLFKNIENVSVENLFKIYSKIDKQSFVAIDEAEKYGKRTSLLLESKSVIQLDNDNVLYVKDWRR